MRPVRFIAVLLYLLDALPLNAQPNNVVGRAFVIDGDTIEIHSQRIRLHGIDAPESAQLCQRPSGKTWRCGQLAALALADRIDRATIRCEPRDRDRYGRVSAVCFRGAEDLNRWMVSAGWAVAYRRYSHDYVAEEDSAQHRKVGVWSGTFDMPWEWRSHQRHH